MINAQYYTDFLYRPRRPEELVTAQGGGVVFSQGAHQVDIVRLLGGGRVASVRALTGAWDPARPTEGAYSALLDVRRWRVRVAHSTAATGISTATSSAAASARLGRPKDAGAYGALGAACSASASAVEEAALKQTRNYGGADYTRRASRATNACDGTSTSAWCSSPATAPICARCRTE